MELAGYARGDRLPEAIEHVEGVVRERRPERNAAAGALHRVHRRPDGRLRRPVHVVHLARHEALQLGGQARRECFAANADRTQAPQRIATAIARDQHAGHRRRALQVRDAVTGDLRGHGVVSQRRAWSARQRTEPIQVLQVPQHEVRLDPEVDQAGDIVDADPLEAVHDLGAGLDGSEEATRLVVALE